MIVENLGIIEYGIAWKYQQELFDAVIQQKIEKASGINHLLFCEHPHVITIGKNGKQDNLLFNESYLKEKGVSVFQIDRGGDITYHGFGQLVVYPIFDLENFGIGLRQYIYNIEEIIIRLLSSYKISASRLEGAAGVWIDANEPKRARKIAAIGVRSSRFVTMHGLALNVNTDLNYFSYINPCGFVDKGVTSMQQELGYEIDMEQVKQRMKCLFEEVFVEK